MVDGVYGHIFPAVQGTYKWRRGIGPKGKTERNCSLHHLHVGDGAVMAVYGPVLKYLLITCRSYNSFSGTSGLLHDEHVRMRAALNASLHWDKIDQEL